VEKKKILLGFTDEAFEKSLKELLKSAGYDAEILARVTKESVRDVVSKTPDLDSVVVMETFPKISATQRVQKYTAEELAALTDDSPVNVIAVLSENHKGTDYARILFASGITSAIFMSGKKGVTTKEVATLIVRRRSRKAAREYYGIGQGNIDLGFLETDDFNETYERFKNRKGSPIENYVFLCANLGEKQAYDFTRRLPKEDRDYLANFEEFHKIVGALEELGYKLNVKRPEKVEIGLANAPMISVKNGAMVIDAEEPKKEAKAEPKKGFSLFGKKKDEETGDPKEAPAETPKAEEKPAEVKEEPVTGAPEEAKAETPAAAEEEKEQVAEEENGFEDLSMEEMLAMLGGVAEEPAQAAPEETKAAEPRAEVKEEVKELPKEETKEEIKEEPKAESKAETKKEETEEVKPKESPKKEEPKKEKPKKESKKDAREEKPAKAAAVKKEEAPTRKSQRPITEEDDDEEEFPLFEDFDDVELKDPRGGKSGLFFLILIIFAAIIGALWYFGNNGGINIGQIDFSKIFG
jgi:hypothetical protein